MSLWEISIALVSITTGPLSLALGMLHMGIAQDTLVKKDGLKSTTAENQ